MHDNLQKIRQGDLETLINYDQQGFILGQDETLDDYANRLQQFFKSNEQLKTDLEKEESICIEDLKVQNNQAIPSDFFDEANKHTKQLFGFSIQQISGFFVNLGLLFGGCAYIFPDKFFSLFFIRSSFINKKKWLIYQRDEIIAHELCHIARFALKSTIFEEIFAYQTSKSKFRKYFASMLQTSADTYLIISAILMTIIAQVIDYFNSYTLWYSSWQIWSWAFFIIIIAYFLTRQFKNLTILKRAIDNLSFISNDAIKIAFRLTDDEIISIAKNDTLSDKKFIKIINSNSKTTQRINILRTIT